MIEVNNLEYSYKIKDEEGNVIGARIALDNISFDIKNGEFVAVLGANGSGKSTLSKTLNGILRPQKGSVKVLGIDTQTDEDIWNVRSNVGMIFQNPDNQIVAGIVEEDVAFGPENMGVPSEEIRKRVDESLAAVHMSKYAKDSPNNLSGGQKQRVAIAGVLAMKPKCIIFDESTAMLDPIGREEVLKQAIKLNKEEKMTIILITHYMEEVVNADKVIVMNEGKIIDVGTPKEIFSKPKMLEENGLEIPLITKIALKLEENGFEIPRGILDRDELVNEIKKIVN